MLTHLSAPACRFARAIAASFAILLASRSAPAAVDLTPHYTDLYSEGVVFHRLYFLDGDKKFLLSLNHETEVVPDAGGTLFRFPKFPDITFLMTRSRLSPDDKFEGATLDRYRESAKRLLPVQAKSSVIREETQNVLPINNWKSYRILLACDMGAVHYLQSVTFLNLNDSDQIVLVAGAPEKDYDEAATRSYRIIRTWQEMLPSDEKKFLHTN